MRRIAVLDKNTIDKIAAGEVVERPSSVVKELTENAIDAGATAVTVEIREGGKSLIRITDNGSGIEKEQVPLAFARHATSKIERVEDLEHIASLGFRGEALSSIAAVAQVELITKTPSAITGTRYVIEGGEEKALEEIGAPEGTTFLVHNLFYNVPVRGKFLKTAVTEGSYVSSLMEQLALSHPEISFKYIVNGQVKLHTSGNFNRRDVIYQIYGRDIVKEIVPVQYEDELLRIEGFIGKPSVSRGNRNFENYYINGRYVKNKIISKAIEDAYKGFLMQHSFPFVSLQIEMTGNHLDVNVHPAKMEVRFSQGERVYQAISQAVSQALTRREMIPEVEACQGRQKKVEKPKVKAKEIPEPFETRERQRIRERSSYQVKEKPLNRWEILERKMEQNAAGHGDLSVEQSAVQENGRQEAEELHGDKPTSEEKPLVRPSSVKDFGRQKPWEGGKQSRQEALSAEVQTEKGDVSPVNVKASERPISQGNSGRPGEKGQRAVQMDLFQERMLSEKARSRHRLIGQVFDTYWLVQYEDKFYIIDQHAAHEKVLYEKIVEQYREKAVISQYLSPPIVVSLTLQEETLLQEQGDLFAQFGFEIEPFGGREYSIHAVPTDLYGHTEAGLFVEMLDELEQDGKITMEAFAGRMATMACKAAVKGNSALSAAEANELIDQLLTLDNPYHCPHGRPTIIAMTRTELEKKFKRIV